MEFQLPYLQQAIFSNNKIPEIEGINHPILEVLNLNCKYYFLLGICLCL